MPRRFCMAGIGSDRSGAIDRIDKDNARSIAPIPGSTQWADAVIIPSGERLMLKPQSLRRDFVKAALNAPFLTREEEHVDRKSVV